MNEDLKSTPDLRREKVLAIVESGRERNAEKPVALEIGALTSYADCLVVMNGSSNRQVGAITDNIVKCLKARGEQPLGVEGLKEASWVLIDADDVIVHVFDSETREHFDLEGLWSDAPAMSLPEEEAQTHLETNDPVPAVPRQSP